MTDTNEATTEAEAVTELAMQAFGSVPVELANIDGFTVAFTKHTDSAGRVTVARERFLPTDAHGNLLAKPARIAQGVTVETEDSLVDYARDFKQSGSRLFASIGTNVIVAVLDYHEGRTTGTKDMGADAPEVDTLHGFDPHQGANFGQHVATLRLPYSQEWQTWTEADGKLVDQLAFARFIQENAPDVATPDAATLLETVRDLRGSRTVKFTGDVNLNSENESFEYSDKSDASSKGELSVPESFMLRLPVYFGGAQVGIQAQLRHKVEESGKLMLGIKLLRAEAVRQATFRQLVQEVADRSGLPVVYGERATGVDMRTF